MSKLLVAIAILFSGSMIVHSAPLNDPIDESSRARSLSRPSREEIIQQVKDSNLLLSSAAVELHHVDELHETFILDGKRISFADADIEPLFLGGGDEEEPTVFQTQVDGDSYIFSKLDGRVTEAVKMHDDHEVTELVSLEDGMYSSFHPSDINQTAASDLGVDVIIPNNNNTQDRRFLRDESQRELQRNCEGNYRLIRIAVAYDSSFCYLHGDDSRRAEAHIRTIVALVSRIYQARHVCKKVLICHINGYCNGRYGRDKYRDTIDQSRTLCDSESVDGRGTLLEEFRLATRDEWENISHKCDTTHFMFGGDRDLKRPYGGGAVGCAYGAICNEFATAVNHMGFSSSLAMQTALVAHELAHNMRAPHTQGNIMHPSICACDRFSPSSLTAMYRTTNEKASDTCLIPETSQAPPVPVTPPPKATAQANNRPSDNEKKPTVLRQNACRDIADRTEQRACRNRQRQKFKEEREKLAKENPKEPEPVSREDARCMIFPIRRVCRRNGCEWHNLEKICRSF